MAITNASIALPAATSNEIISNVIGNSAVMQMGRQVQLNGHGEAIPVITGDPTAYFVDEGATKTNSDATIDVKTMKPRTIAIISPFSNQFREDNEALYGELVRRLPMLLAQRFDEEVFHGTPVSGFDTLNGATAVSLGSDAWAGLVTARSTVEAADGELNGWAMSNQGITAMLSEKDANGRPLFVDSVTEGKFGTILGEDVVKAKKAFKNVSGGNNVLGFAGDWTKAVWGIVDSVDIAIADQATLTTGDTTLNLFESNMFAVRAEIRVSFAAAMANQFVKITA